MSMAPVFLDIEKAFDTTWLLGLLYKFLITLINRISSFPSVRKFKSFGQR
jgi:hypothetical protein